jgi:hypothetical protein
MIDPAFPYFCLFLIPFSHMPPLSEAFSKALFPIANLQGRPAMEPDSRLCSQAEFATATSPGAYDPQRPNHLLWQWQY